MKITECRSAAATCAAKFRHSKTSRYQLTANARFRARRSQILRRLTRVRGICWGDSFALALMERMRRLRRWMAPSLPDAGVSLFRLWRAGAVSEHFGRLIVS